MLSRSIKVVTPKVLELYIEDINCGEGECLVRIEKAAICKADIRYYEGHREPKLLGAKYPMNLIHEVVGSVIKDKSEEFEIGDKVILVPNIIKECRYNDCLHRVCRDLTLGENYCDIAKFCSSNYDGFSKEIISIPKRNIVKVNNYIDSNVAVFSELVSVIIAVFRRIDYVAKQYERIHVWGDGILGYIASSIAKNILKKEVIVIGKHIDKLKQFCCDKYIKVEDINNIHNYNMNLVVECVGGKGMNDALSSILEIINPGGKIILTGVSEENLSIDSRKILEKGLIITGSTRSNINDFKEAVKCFENDSFIDSIKKIVLGEIDIKGISDFYFAFEKTCNNNKLGKYIMNFMF